MRHILENLLLGVMYPRLMILRLRRGLHLRVLVELRQLHDSGVFAGITHVVDAGAHHGVYAEAALCVIPGVRVLCFEPAPEAYAVLTERFSTENRVRCLCKALGATPETKTLYLSGVDQAASLLQMNRLHEDTWAHSGRTGESEVEVVCLEGFLDEFTPEARVFLKIDVQGYEREVLLGCGDSLRKVSVIQVELSLVELYDGAPLLPEMVQFLNQAGYDLYDVVGRVDSPSEKRSMQLDLLFLRRCNSI